MCSRVWFCQKQNANATPSATRQTISRVRNSSKCSTRLRCSSWPTGRIARGMPSQPTWNTPEHRPLKQWTPAADDRSMNADRNKRQAEDLRLSSPPGIDVSCVEQVEGYDESTHDPELCRCPPTGPQPPAGCNGDSACRW